MGHKNNRLRSNKELVQTYLSDKSINFVGFAVTPWQAHGIDLCIRELVKRGFLLKGVILIGSHSVTGFCIKETKFNNLGMGTFQVLYYPSFCKEPFGLSMLRYFLGGRKEKKRKDGKAGLKFAVNPFGVPYDVIYGWHCQDKNSKIVAIWTEEGLGQYFRTSKNWMMENHIPLTRKGKVQYQLKKAMKTLLNLRLEKKGELFRMQLFDARYGKLYPCMDTARRYMCLFKQSGAPPDRASYENTVLVNTQAFMLDHKASGSCDLTCLLAACQVLKQAGYTVVLKPHPRERGHVERYRGLPVIIDENYGVSQELLLAQAECLPVAVVGFYSTTLLTGKLFWNLPAVSLNALIDKNGLDPVTKSDMESFSKRFSHFIYEPKTISGLKEVIKKIENNKKVKRQYAFK